MMGRMVIIALEEPFDNVVLYPDTKSKRKGKGKGMDQPLRFKPQIMGLWCRLLLSRPMMWGTAQEFRPGRGLHMIRILLRAPLL